MAQQKESHKWGYFRNIVPVLIIGLISILFTYDNLIEQALKRRDSTAQLGANVLSEKLSRVNDLGLSLATRVKFRKFISKKDYEGAIDIVSDIPNNFEFVESLSLVSPEGIVWKDIPKVFCPRKLV